jgi:hypothetical protein
MATPGRITPKTKIFQLKIALAGIRPPVWRRVLPPGETTLAELHDVVQVAMGWTDTHLHEFEIGDARYGLPDPDWGRDEVKDEARAKLFRLARCGQQVPLQVRLRRRLALRHQGREGARTRTRRALPDLQRRPSRMPSRGRRRPVGLPRIPRRSRRSQAPRPRPLERLGRWQL